MLKDRDGGDQHPNIINYCYTLYHIEVFEGVQLYKVRVKDNIKRIREQSEWDCNILNFDLIVMGISPIYYDVTLMFYLVYWA